MNTQTYSVLTVIGKDRIGIVQDIASHVASQDGNIEGSKMAVLGGEFAAILLITTPTATFASFSSSLESLGEKLDLHLVLKPTTKPERTALGRPYILETVSLDSPGIIRSVTDLLKRHNLNIAELETNIEPAPWTGAPMFHMRATLILGASVQMAAFKADLAVLEGEMNLDLSLRPASATKPD
jgi:glycine cleavage system transcriptional repressor